jgi:hypothetical protein
MSRKQMVKIQELHQSWQGSRGFRMILIFFTTTFWTEVSNAIMHHCFNCFLSIQRLLLGKASWRWTERKSWNLDLDVCVCKAKARSCKHTCRRFPILAAYNRQNPEILTCIWRQWSIFFSQSAFTSFLVAKSFVPKLKRFCMKCVGHRSVAVGRVHSGPSHSVLTCIVWWESWLGFRDFPKFWKLFVP